MRCSTQTSNLHQFRLGKSCWKRGGGGPPLNETVDDRVGEFHSQDDDDKDEVSGM